MTERDHLQHFIDTIPEPTLILRIVGKEDGSGRNTDYSLLSRFLNGP